MESMRSAAAQTEAFMLPTPYAAAVVEVKEAKNISDFESDVSFESNQFYP